MLKIRNHRFHRIHNVEGINKLARITATISHIEGGKDGLFGAVGLSHSADTASDGDA